MEENAVNRYRVVIIGGSAGSLEVILKIVTSLPLTGATSFIIIIHRKNDTDSILSDLLSSRTSLPVKQVEDKEPILVDTVYIAPSDYHLLIEDEDHFSLDRSEKVHFSRPSIDVTMQMVADVFGPRSIGILLSGANADGAEGLLKIKKAGGFAIAQDPDSAEVNFMPREAIKLNASTEILKPLAICEKIISLLK